MKILVALLLPLACAAADIRLSERDLAEAGRKIWQNESGGKIAGLTAWNTGEDFASLGIGHFIWYSKGAGGPFDESFPPLLVFLEKRGAKLPAWLDPRMPCPWPDRAAFLRDFDGPRLTELRRFLAGTIREQTEFIVARLEASLDKMLAAAPRAERENVRRQFERLGQTGAGTFAMIDYVNFKGEGTLETERYEGEGWGLLQVLSGMRGTGGSAPAEFAESGAAVLTRRVRNSPPARNESRWLPGWKNRVTAYAR